MPGLEIGEAPKQKLSPETTYAIFFARRVVGDRLVNLMRALGNRTYLHTGHLSPEGRSLDALDNWGNVPRHGLLEAIGVDIVEEWLGFGPEIEEPSVVAAFLHDAYKKEELLFRSRTSDGRKKMERSLVFDRYERSGLWNCLEALGMHRWVRDKVLAIAEGAGTESYGRVHWWLEKGWKNLSEIEKAAVILHVVDDMTANDRIADFRERIDGVYRNPNYQFISEASKEWVRDYFFAEANLDAYGKGKIGERSLSILELDAYNHGEISGNPSFPSLTRMQEVVGLRARMVLAEAMGLRKERLNDFVIQELFRRQQRFA